MKKALIFVAALLVLLVAIPLSFAVDITPPPDVTLPPDINPPPIPQASPTGDGERTGLASIWPFNMLGDDMTVEDSTSTVEILILLTILSLAPSILIMVTAFTRIIIVLSFTRSALGTQQMPPNQVMVGLALFLTFLVMFPVFDNIKTNAWDPYAEETIAMDEMLERTMSPLRDFMYGQIRLQHHESDLKTFIQIAKLDNPQSIDDVPTHVLIPAFIISEIKTGFIIGFIIYIPFIVIDMVVASALMSMGMMMLPPVMISLPFKIMLFVLVDGWNLTVGTLVKTFS
ncbi:flagellar biosynthetic protein FliP [Clostridia bacterium]|nr:flagellar biosynthetic protein FliP [Clostridia bacterium]